MTRSKHKLEFLSVTVSSASCVWSTFALCLLHASSLFIEPVYCVCLCCLFLTNTKCRLCSLHLLNSTENIAWEILHRDLWRTFTREDVNFLTRHGPPYHSKPHMNVTNLYPHATFNIYEIFVV